MMERNKSDEELIQKTDIAISELVYDKDDLQKAYNYYNCKRDAEQFKYLEENFGLGNPTSIEFTPLIRKHVDALILQEKRNSTYLEKQLRLYKRILEINFQISWKQTMIVN